MFMEIAVQEVVNGDKHTVWNMMIRHLCTLCAPGCRCGAPSKGTKHARLPPTHCRARKLVMPCRRVRVCARDPSGVF